MFPSVKLSGVEGNLDSPPQFADANIIHTIEGPVEKAIGKFDVVNDAEKARDTDQRVDFLAFEDAGNLDFVVGIDFLAGVIERFHFLVVFCSGYRAVRSCF